MSEQIYIKLLINLMLQQNKVNSFSRKVYCFLMVNIGIVIQSRSLIYAVDGDNTFGLSNNNQGEAVTGTIVFSTGEWYSFSFYLILIDNIVQGYFTSRRLG